MPKWILICKSCKFDFQHSQVGYTGMASFYAPLKPELPPGNTCVCPNCGYSGIYERADLIYKATEAH